MFDPASPRPLYLQLADYLRRQIESGAFKPGDRLTPEVELAAQFNLARGTVRQALQLLVNQGLLQRTRRKGTFIADARQAASSSLITIIVPYLRDLLTVDIVRGAESVLRLHGYSLIFKPSEGNLEIEADHIRQLASEKTGGLILFPVAMPGEAELLTRHLGPDFPVILVDRHIPGYEAASVFVDNYSGAYHAVEHLIALGHQQIGCITHEGNISAIEDRVRGYEQALHDAGLHPLPVASLRYLDPEPEAHIPVYTPDQLEPVRALLDLPQPPTAFFCINDHLALATMRYLLAAGLRIPEDVALVGFDDIPLAPFMPVPLTTVAQPKFEIGARAALLLLDKLAGKEPGNAVVLMPTALVVRTSTVGADGRGPAPIS